jgi:hypothetical protein
LVAVDYVESFPGNSKVQAALRKLDEVTKAEYLMTAARTLTITEGIKVIA